MTVELPEDVKSGNEPDKAEAHEEDDGGRDLQPGSIISVESEHVCASSGAADRACAVAG